MKSLAITMHVKSDIAAQLTNDRVEPARRGAILARLFLWRGCDDWRPQPNPRKSWSHLRPVSVVIMVYDPDAAALLAADVDELRPLLRNLSPLAWRFIKTVDPDANRPAVALRGVTVADVQRSDDSYDRAAVMALLHDAPVLTTAN